jgi:hypothetical protein
VARCPCSGSRQSKNSSGVGVALLVVEHARLSVEDMHHRRDRAPGLAHRYCPWSHSLLQPRTLSPHHSRHSHVCPPAPQLVPILSILPVLQESKEHSLALLIFLLFGVHSLQRQGCRRRNTQQASHHLLLIISKHLSKKRSRETVSRSRFHASPADRNQLLFCCRRSLSSRFLDIARN